MKPSAASPLTTRSQRSKTVRSIDPGVNLNGPAGHARALDQERLQLALEAGHMGVWEWDLATGKSVWNTQLYQLIGVPVESTDPAAEVFMALVHPDDRVTLDAKLAHALAHKSDFSDEFRLMRADTGEQRWIAARGRVLCNAMGESVAMVGVNFDITDETHNQEKLKAVTRRRAEFLAMLGHELRNPLAPLTYVARMMESAASKGTPLIHLADIIRRQVGQLTRLVDDLLEVSRIELGKIDLNTEILPVATVIETTVETVMPEVNMRGQRLDVALPPDIVINGDRVRLAQVLINLLSNASKFTQEGGTIELDTQVHPQTVEITIRDNGPGIDDGLIALLFEPFTQGHTTLDRARDGLGLGLSIAKRLVELHGGSITLSTSSTGTAFTVSLPSVSAPQDEPEVAGLSASHLAGLRFLVVEDNEDAAYLLAELLKLNGHQVLIANDGEAGLAVAHQERPDVILMDIGLPKLDGWSVAEKIRTTDSLKDTVMIAMSGYGQPSDRQRSLQAGFDLHLSKPADVDEVLRHLSTTHLRRVMNA